MSPLNASRNSGIVGSQVPPPINMGSTGRERSQSNPVSPRSASQAFTLTQNNLRQFNSKTKGSINTGFVFVFLYSFFFCFFLYLCVVCTVTAKQRKQKKDAKLRNTHTNKNHNFFKT